MLLYPDLCTLHGETYSRSEYPKSGLFLKPISSLQTFPQSPVGNGVFLVAMEK